jgi:hypothetical protein
MRPSTLERAFELAESGLFVTVTELRSRLSAESYFTEEICGPVLCKQLLSIMAKARLAHMTGRYHNVPRAHRHSA